MCYFEGFHTFNEIRCEIDICHPLENQEHS